MYNDKKREALESDMMRVHLHFKERVLKFIDEFYNQNGVLISTTQATKIIDEKIERQGGLKAK